MSAPPYVWLHGREEIPGVVVVYLTVDASGAVSYPDLIEAHSGDVILWMVRNDDTNWPEREVRLLKPFTEINPDNNEVISDDADPLENLCPSADTSAKSKKGSTEVIATRVKASNDRKPKRKYKYTLDIEGLEPIDPDLDITPPHD